MLIKNYVFFIYFLCCSADVIGFRLNRVIIASDTNPMYLDFWPIVARAWKQCIGIQPTLALIADKDISVDTTVGDVLRFDPIPNVSTAQQAQMIRMLLPVLFENDFCIISDIDMLPMSRQYFFDATKNIGDDNLVTFHDGVYGYSNGLPKQLSMCYIAGKGKTFKEIFQVHSLQEIATTIKNWAIGYEKKWGRDEEILTQYILDWHKKTKRCVFLGHNARYVCEHRISRDASLSKWTAPYMIQGIKEEWYHDSHMLRPFTKHQKKIQDLTDELGIK